MKKLLSLLLISFMLFALVPSNALAVETSGSLGNTSWSFLEDGTLYITGHGEIMDFNQVNVPWEELKPSIIRVHLDEGIDTVPSYSFWGCENLTEVIIDGNLEKIYHTAFSGASKLESITFPDSLTFIGNNAFEGCSSLKCINIPNGVTEICSDTFKNCTSLEKVILHDDIVFIGNGAFSGCTALTHFDMPLKVTTVSCALFSGCESLEGIALHDGITSIGPNAFKDCTSLKNVRMSPNMEQITMNSFMGCTSLESIVIPEGVTVIGPDTFSGCENLTDIYCEAESQPEEWLVDWNGASNAQVHWGYDAEYYWGGSVADGFESGSGTESDPYVITTAEQLAYLAKTVNEGNDYSGKYILLGNDIFLNDVSSENWTSNATQWTSIGQMEIITMPDFDEEFFCGNFDGGNHVVSGLYIDSEYGDKGLFGHAENATIKNLGIVDSYIKASYHVGAIAGFADICYIENCYNTSLVLGHRYTGGLVGNTDFDYVDHYDTTVFKNCYNTGDVISFDDPLDSSSVTAFTGGIAGATSIDYAKFIDCYNTGNVSGRYNVGGIVGCNSTGYKDLVVMNRCYNTGNITGTHGVGGIMGSGSVCVANCYNTGDVSGNDKVGGISGNAPFSTKNCYNVGKVTGELMAGAIIGRYSSYDYPVVNCYYLEGSADSGRGEHNKNITYDTYEYIPVPDAEGEVVSLTLEEMKLQSSFKGFDFDNVWTMEGDESYLYPEFYENVSVEGDQGDVNADGKLTAVDYLMLKKVIFGSLSVSELPSPETAAKRCDLNGDGNYTAADYMMLKRIIFVG